MKKEKKEICILAEEGSYCKQEMQKDPSEEVPFLLKSGGMAEAALTVVQRALCKRYLSK